MSEETKDVIGDYFHYKEMFCKVYKEKTGDIYENSVLAGFALQQLLYENYMLKIKELKEKIADKNNEILELVTENNKLRGI